MFFETTLYQGRLIKRYKRFLADIELADGTLVTAHCANTGAMTGCAESGWQVWLSLSNNPKRKLAYSWELVQSDVGHYIGINTYRANELVAEALYNKLITELKNYETIRREVKLTHDNSRIDFMLSAPDLVDCFVEVKSVTLLQDQQGYFPDAVTQRGHKHLRALAELANQGKRAVLLFCVQHNGISSVKIADHIDPQYKHELEHALSSGVEVLVYSANISPEKILINQSLPFIL
ncbi:DNA/RNA nuclease SfsA [Paraglaciecola hydrolytica]|uniref:Sugar fermentation stimulation protein homolog n=1 Tax=Paraglaciecola hydrolytica TaxID=1799789 RepID=A0A136A380_9ALTE|nr:DNA/RNA nuclease SfsA [Paraglaciecola hydrolytica]KXI29709.1 sugar fermentation stimulation protein SfsA [Paraglaciecola hydrolytica]